MNEFRDLSPALVLALWDLGCDTNEIANRLGSRESDVYRVLIRRLAIRRKNRNDKAHPPVPAECEQAMADKKDRGDV